VEPERILVLDADPPQRAQTAAALLGEGFAVLEVATAETALEALRGAPFDGVLCSARAAGWSASAVLSLARAAGSDATFVVGCRRDAVDSAIEALRGGADGYVVLPEETARAGVVLQRALEKRRLRREARELRDRARARLAFIGAAPEALAIGEVVRRAAPTKATVLLAGETGTGKSLVAEMIHEASPRRDRPFVGVSCAGLSETLLELRLFGCEQGMAEDLQRRREGLIDRADGGTLYLHEVANLSPALQVKLLRLLQHGEFERVGEGGTQRADVRVVASTRTDLGEEVRAGRFRDDLYYRLNVVSLSVPSLRARKGDIPALAAHFLGLHGRAAGKLVKGLTPGALSALFAYDWPGNVRELENAMERAAALCRSDLAGVDDLPPVLHGARPEETASSALIPGASLFEIEREAILRTLESVGGSTARAAEVLGVSVRKVQYRLKEYRTGQAPVRVRMSEA
jgi:two-component system NtrC family response regulator